MTITRQFRPTRAPRANLRGTVSALVQLENMRRIPAKIHQISITGGLLELTTYVEERAKVHLAITIGSCVIRPRAVMLFPMHAANSYLQPFRFSGLTDDERHLLDREITVLLKQALAAVQAGHGQGFRPPRFYLETF